MSRPRTVFVCVLLALVTLLVYLPVRNYPFVNLDDGKYVTENPMIQAGLTWAGVKYAFTAWYGDFWHPLTCLSHMLDCQLFGLNAGRHHLVNVLFHATNAVLLLLLLWRMTGAFWQSAFIAALFAWHPLRVESVAWVAERKDVLSAFFGLLTLMAYVRYVHGVNSGMWQVTRTNPIKSRVTCHASRYYWLALLFFALGLMAKPTLVTLPFVFLLLDYWPLRRSSEFGLPSVASGRRMGVRPALRSLWAKDGSSESKNAFSLSTLNCTPNAFGAQLSTILEKWPFFALAAASCVVTFVAQKRGEAVAPLEGYPLSSRIGNAAVAYVKYLFNSVYPVNLAVIYPLPKEIPWVQVVGAMMVLAVISWVIWRARRQRPYLLTGWLWYLGMLVPAVGLVQVGSQAMADRFTYLPLIGVFIGVVFGLGDLAKKLRLGPMVMISAAVIVLAGCLFATARQLRFWRDGETLFERALAVTKDNPVAHYTLGNCLLQRGQVEEAIAQFQKALEIAPGYTEAHDNLGIAFLHKGQVNEAMAHFQKALELQPNNVEVQNNLAWVLATAPNASLRNGVKAVGLAQQAKQLSGGQRPAIIGTLAAAYAEAGRFPEAVTTARQALQLATGQTSPAAVDALRTQIGLYQAGLPFRDPSLTNTQSTTQ
ncbi:MAG: tetratricopeptide repeat protein [Verrucomicrobiota bacterium]|jgi:tetratricopeptide (TPR) repeat protein